MPSVRVQEPSKTSGDGPGAVPLHPADVLPVHQVGPPWNVEPFVDILQTHLDWNVLYLVHVMQLFCNGFYLTTVE